jgi:putative transposase
MAPPALRIVITRKDRKDLKKLLSGGVQAVRVVLRALALLQLAEGVSAPRIAGMVPLTAKAIRKIGHRYREAGLERAPYEKERPGAVALLEDKQRIIAMVCSDPPEGGTRWTVRLVVEEAIKRRLVPQVGSETIRVLLLHHDLKPWRKMLWRVAMNRHGLRMEEPHKKGLAIRSAPRFALLHCVVSVKRKQGKRWAGH